MVFAVDKNQQPLGVVTERRARILMEKERARLCRNYPAVLQILDVDASQIQDTLPSFRIKIDPGSKYTGISVIRENDCAVVFEMQIEHRADMVRTNLQTRADARRNRRNRELWHRKNKFWSFRTGPRNQGERPSQTGKLAPSIQSIADNIIHWVSLLRRWLPNTSCSFEAVRIDSQLLDNPNIQGVQYQQGTLLGYELREYLLEKYQHTCQYCGNVSGDPVLEWEHMLPKSRGGTDTLRNATLACHTCNQDKGNHTVDEYLDLVKARVKGQGRKKDPVDKARLECIPKVLDGKQVGASNRYSAWVTTMRKSLERRLFEIFGEENVECSSGGRTKYNRTQLGLPKDHHLDARCVGTIPPNGYKDLTHGFFLYAKATGRGTHFRGKINKCGVIVKKLKPRAKKVFGFRNGDIVRVNVPKGKYKGRHIGRVMTRAKGIFDVRTSEGIRFSVSHKYCTLLQRQDGYQYAVIRQAHSPRS